MKNLKYILIATIIMFIGINGVSAKTTAKSCEYNYYDSLSGNSSKLELVIYTDKTARAIIREWNGQELNGSGSNIRNEESIKSHIENLTCPKYSIVRYGDRISFVMFADNRSTLDNYLTENNLNDEKNHISSATEYNSTSPESEKYYNEMLTESENILKETENFNIDECKDESKDITAYQACNDKYDGLKHRINNFNLNLNTYISQNYIDENDQRTTTMKENIKNSESNLVKVKYEIDNEIEIIEPDYKYGCEIFGDTLVDVIRQIYGYFKWIIPVLIVVLSMLDFVKVVGTGKDDDFKKAQSNLLKRVVLGIIFFIVPTLISLVINFSGVTEQFENGDSIVEAVTCILK